MPPVVWRAFTDFYDDLRTLRVRHPQVSSLVEAGDDRLFLDGIYADPVGEGHGSEFMADLTVLLDRHTLNMELEPSAEQGDAVRDRYARFGFVSLNPGVMRRDPVIRQEEPQP